MKKIKFRLDLEQFRTLEGILDSTLGKNDKDKFESSGINEEEIKELGAEIIYGKTATLLVINSPIHRLNVKLSYNPILTENQKFMTELEEKLPELYQTITKYSLK